MWARQGPLSTRSLQIFGETLCRWLFWSKERKWLREAQFTIFLLLAPSARGWDGRGHKCEAVHSSWAPYLFPCSPWSTQPWPHPSIQRLKFLFLDGAYCAKNPRLENLALVDSTPLTTVWYCISLTFPTHHFFVKLGSWAPSSLSIFSDLIF